MTYLCSCERFADFYGVHFNTKKSDVEERVVKFSTVTVKKIPIK